MKKKENLVETAKITSKGQITIPKKVRELLNLKDGDHVIFYYDEEKNIKISNEKNMKLILEDETMQTTMKRGTNNE